MMEGPNVVHLFSLIFSQPELRNQKSQKKLQKSQRWRISTGYKKFYDGLENKKMHEFSNIAKIYRSHAVKKPKTDLKKKDIRKKNFVAVKNRNSAEFLAKQTEIILLKFEFFW